MVWVYSKKHGMKLLKTSIMIRKALIKDKKTVAELALLLWPHHNLNELELEMNEFICCENATIFLAFDNHIPIGFVQCQLRTDYVEGTDSSPVGYLEGIFVKEDYRYKGTARKLVEQCEIWAKEKGCLEFASDCEIMNIDSLQFHLHLKFIEVNRIICFTKKLDNVTNFISSKINL